jgi:hypothetical protein
MKSENRHINLVVFDQLERDAQLIGLHALSRPIPLRKLARGITIYLEYGNGERVSVTYNLNSEGKPVASRAKVTVKDGTTSTLDANAIGALHLKAKNDERSAQPSEASRRAEQTKADQD